MFVCFVWLRGTVTTLPTCYACGGPHLLWHAKIWQTILPLPNLQYFNPSNIFRYMVVTFTDLVCCELSKNGNESCLYKAYTLGVWDAAPQIISSPPQNKIL